MGRSEMEDSTSQNVNVLSEDQENIDQSLQSEDVPAKSLNKRKKQRNKTVQITIRLTEEQDEGLMSLYLRSPFDNYSSFLVNEILLNQDTREESKPSEVRKLKAKITELETKLTNLRKAYVSQKKKDKVKKE